MLFSITSKCNSIQQTWSNLYKTNLCNEKYIMFSYNITNLNTIDIFHKDLIAINNPLPTILTQSNRCQ